VLCPKGYQRSDEHIHEAVCEALTRHPQVDASEIEITVSNGEVTLKGTVENRQMKRMAEECAESVSGVKEVENQIRVSQHQQSQTGQQCGQSHTTQSGQKGRMNA
jgi:osmotically-inducible protein OsmY